MTPPPCAARLSRRTGRFAALAGSLALALALAPAPPLRAQSAPAAAPTPAARPADAKADAKTPRSAQKTAQRTAPAARPANFRPRRPEEVPPFSQPAFLDQLRQIAFSFSKGDLRQSAALLQAVIRAYPEMYAMHYSLATVRAHLGEREGALASLSRAVDLGLRAVDETLAEPAFAGFAGDPEFAAILQRMRTPPPPEAVRPVPAPVPAKVVDGVAPVSEANALFAPATRSFRIFFDFPDARPPGPVSGRDGKLGRLVNLWYRRGRAAGNGGDLYDNLDRGHSLLPADQLPQLARVEYDAAARRAGFDYGLKRPLDFGAPTLGNSSTARKGGPGWRSMTRQALTSPDGARELFRQYVSNQIYVYPEHNDHDPFWGDVFPANTPYAVTSQGSSGSDQRFLLAIGLAMAALQPEVKAFAVKNGLLAPTIQTLLRWGQKHVTSVNAYLSGRAHPTVFDRKALAISKIVRRANLLTVDGLPPMVRLRVVEEDRPVAGIELFGEGLSETLFDTPSAIARIARGTAGERRMVVSAAATRDPNGRDLTFKWVVLRGDATRIRITPLDAAGTAAEIVIPWHDEISVPGAPELRSQRVDIGVFANNGVHYSAPAFVSMAFPPRETRVYDDQGRIRSVSYDAPERQERYSDPFLYAERRWRDDYLYDSQGRPLGWTRTGPDGVAAFTRHGARVLTRDALGRPLSAEILAYPLRPAARKARKGRKSEVGRMVAQVPTGARLLYSYDGPDDRYGVATPIAADAAQSSGG